MNNPIYILTHENAVLKMRYYEVLDKYNKSQNEFEILKTAYDTKENTYKNTLMYLQNMNIELNKIIIDKNKQILTLQQK